MKSLQYILNLKNWPNFLKNRQRENQQRDYDESKKLYLIELKCEI